MEELEEERRIAREEAANAQENGQVSTSDPKPNAAATTKKPNKNEQSSQPPAHEAPTIDDDLLEEKDPNKPDLDPDDVTEALEEFIQVRDDMIDNADPLGNPALKKKSNFQTEE